MKIIWKLAPLLWLFMFFALACSNNQGTPEPVATIVVDKTCQGLVSHSFISSVSYLLGDSEQGPVYGPHMVSFLNDGRAIWKYSTVSYIGTYTCENGQFIATFADGEKKSLEGTYISETDMLRVEDVNYLKATEQ
ncbi:MAG: hypothetical protein H6636_05840 [Anaerolineales bacterium]|nr:hypothetical protein [Anaerolineales bacterium]